MGFRLNNSALLVIDAQAPMIDRDGADRAHLSAAAQKTTQLIAETRETAAMPIIHMAMTSNARPDILRYDSQEPHLDMMRFIDGARPQGHEGLLLKDIYSGVRGTQLVDELKRLDVQDVFLVGFHTSACVQDNADDLMQAGFKVHVIRGATASPYPDRTEGALSYLQTQGAQVMGFDDFRRHIWPENPLGPGTRNPHTMKPLTAILA